MKLVVIVSVFACLILSSSPITAKIINVPADSSTIQAGINGATNGDTVLVAKCSPDNPYKERIDFCGKAILLTSRIIFDSDTANIIDSTIIDGDPSELESPDTITYLSVVRFVNGEDSTSIIQGFTIRNGIGTHLPYLGDRFGGGICCDSASPTIQHNIVKSNSARWGGGIYCAYSAPVIKYNTLTANSCTVETGGAFGGAINGYHSAPRITDNNITGNHSSSSCAGIYLYGEPRGFGYPSIARNMITFNTACSTSTMGGAVYYQSCLDSCGDLSENTIRGNTGGVIYSDWGYPSISRNTIVRNSGVYTIWIEDCHDRELLVENNTIDSNTCSYAIYAKTCNGFNITNNIITNNNNQKYAMKCACDEDTGVVTFNDFWGNANDTIKCNIDSVGVYSWGTNFNGDPCDSFYNISQDPMFADTTSYALLCSSACVEAGDSNDTPPDSSGCRVDMGVYEVFHGFVCGNVNNSGGVDASDCVYLINYLWFSGPAPVPLASGDVDHDGDIDIADSVYLNNYVYHSGPAPCCSACL